MGISKDEFLPWDSVVLGHPIAVHAMVITEGIARALSPLPNTETLGASKEP